jgi:hypothetical protein
VLENHVVCEDADGEFGELEAAQKMLNVVLGHFGVYHSEHNRKNLVIEIKENKMEEEKQ